jgi:excinuclease ABC subunit C
MVRATKRLPDGGRPTSPEELAALERHVLAGAEARPGVYRMMSEGGGVLYVGKSKRVRERLLGYFRCGRRDKGARILRETRAIDWAYAPSEFAALREELRLIKQLRPRFNVMQKRDAGHYAFVRVTCGPAPRLDVARAEAGAPGTYYGPFIGPGLVAEAARELSDALGLRDCPDRIPMIFRAESALIPLGHPGSLRTQLLTMGPPAAPNPGALRTPDCIRHEIGKCLGPCIAACTTSEYDERVALATGFLEGRGDALLGRLRREMLASKAALAYERAALFRDRILKLERLQDQLAKVRFGLESLSLVYPVPGTGGDDRVYLIRRGVVRAEVPAPRGTPDRMALQALIDRVFSREGVEKGGIQRHEIEEILLVTAWFRRHPAELARAWRPTL